MIIDRHMVDFLLSFIEIKLRDTRTRAFFQKNLKKNVLFFCSVLDMKKLESEVLENPLSIDTDSKTQVVGWDRYIDLDINSCPEQLETGTPSKSLSPLSSTYKSPIKKHIGNVSSGNVFDSLFTNSFLSSSAYSSAVDSRATTVSTKPKRDILGNKKKKPALKNNNNIAISTTTNNNHNATIGFDQDNFSKPKAVTFTTSRGTSTDSMTVDASVDEILNESRSFKEELRACEENDTKVNNVSF